MNDPNPPQNLCKNCIHFYSEQGFSNEYCKQPNSLPVVAKVAREDMGHCGPEAKYFKEKD